jgi:hypothetical protein
MTHPAVFFIIAIEPEHPLIGFPLPDLPHPPLHFFRKNGHFPGVKYR